MSQFSRSLFLIIGSITLCQCHSAGSGAGGGSGGGSTGGGGGAAGVQGLTVASQLSVVDPKSMSAQAGELGGPPAGSAYVTDKADVHVAEESAQVFNQVNQILCFVEQTKYGQFVNKGAYRALVDKTPCAGTRDNPQSQDQSQSSQSSGSGAPSYMDWTVNVTRANDTSPQEVDVWVHAPKEGHDGLEMRIKGKLSISEGASASNALGLFKMDYAGYPVLNGTLLNQTMMNGYIEVANKDGKPVLSSYDNGHDGPQKISTRRAVINRSTDGSSGAGVTDDNGQSQFSFAYSGDYFRRSGGGKDQCFSRTNFDETVWSYGLYEASTGARINRDSGFPVSVTQNGKTINGWVGYWGVGFQGDVTLHNGDTVTRQSQNGGTGTPYTLFQAGGRLVKNTRKSLTLADIAGIEIEWHPQTGNNTYRVYWDKTAQKFYKSAQAQSSMNMMGPPSWSDISPVQAVTANDLQNEFNFNAWSQALGGQVGIPLRNAQNQVVAFTNASAVSVLVQSVQSPRDVVPTTLSCYDNCPDATKLAMNGTHQSGVRADYSFDSTTMLLKEGSTEIVSTSSIGNGMQTGPLFVPDSTNLALLKCDWNPDQICTWKAWQVLDVFYSWQSGANQWNQLTLLKDGNGKFVVFDPPLPVVLSYSSEAVRLSSSELAGKLSYQAGTRFQLDYMGFGNLGGIPGKCFDPQTNQLTQCGMNVRWLPEFSIKDGTLLSLATNETVRYLARGLGKEQRMTKVDAANCSSLTLSSNLTLPSSDNYLDPSSIGDEPTVIAAPAVVGGVVQ